MNAKSASQAFVDGAAIVQQQDLADTVARLLENCAGLTGATAIGLLVRNERSELELLSPTSHQAAELDLYQLQHETGPCVDAARDGIARSAYIDDIPARWGKVGAAIHRAYPFAESAPRDAVSSYACPPVVAGEERIHLLVAGEHGAGDRVEGLEDLGGLPGDLSDLLRYERVGRDVATAVIAEVEGVGDVDDDLGVQRCAVLLNHRDGTLPRNPRG